MKPQFEHVTIPKGCSIRVFHRQIPEIPFEWHHHPECELTLTLNSRGLRFIADHIGAYDSHDLVLVPSEMPHTWASTKAIDESRPHVAVVVWFTGSWALRVADVCPEYSSLRKLLKRAATGLSFPFSAGEMMESRLSGLFSNSARERLRSVLDLLAELADMDAVPLSTEFEAKRIGRIRNVMAIIIVAPEIELHADWIEWGLKEAGFEVIRWAGLGWLPKDSATIYLGDQEEIYLGNHKLSSKDTVWFKRPRLALHPEVDPLDKKFAANEYEAFRRNLLSHIELSGARCINKWSTVLTVENKSLQLSLASRCGLRVPATRIGNCASFVKAFLAGPEADVIHKAFRPHAWIRADGAIYNCETTGLSGDCEWLDDTFAYAPGIYQQRIQKNCDVRVNMIGADFHSFVITTPGIALDWRSHGLRDGLRVERITLPLEIESALRAFADRAELAFGCFDMVVDSAGVWWFLEVNQAGQFLWIDDLQPDDGVYEPMLRFLSATEPASDRGFPTFRRCLAQCKVTEDVIPPEEDFPFRTVEEGLKASSSPPSQPTSP